MAVKVLHHAISRCGLNLITPARDTKQCGGWEVYVPDTSNSSYGTATNEVRHYRNCSSKAFYVDLYIWRISQDLHTRTSCEHPRRNFIQAPMQKIFKILMQGPLEEDFNRISTRSFQKVPDHVRTPRGFHQDLFKSVSQGPAQDHAKASESISLGSLENLRARNCKGLEQDLHARTPKRDHDNTGDPDCVRACASKWTWTCHKSHFMREF